MCISMSRLSRSFIVSIHICSPTVAFLNPSSGVHAATFKIDYVYMRSEYQSDQTISVCTSLIYSFYLVPFSVCSDPSWSLSPQWKWTLSSTYSTGPEYVSLTTRRISLRELLSYGLGINVETSDRGWKVGHCLWTAFFLHPLYLDNKSDEI